MLVVASGLELLLLAQTSARQQCSKASLVASARVLSSCNFYAHHHSSKCLGKKRFINLNDKRLCISQDVIDTPHCILHYSYKNGTSKKLQPQFYYIFILGFQDEQHSLFFFLFVSLVSLPFFSTDSLYSKICRLHNYLCIYKL